jgi:RNA polymerase sigma-70 factor (ECF subfamily)
MRLGADGSTSPTLLREVSNWQDHPAWVTFRGRYDPLLRRWYRGYGLDEDSVDEVCQRIWIELADRMRTFQYDPKGTFRGWLRRVCDSRVIDFLRQRHAICLRSFDDRDGEAEAGARPVSIDLDESDQGESADDDSRRFLRDEAEKV